MTVVTAGPEMRPVPKDTVSDCLSDIRSRLDHPLTDTDGPNRAQRQGKRQG